MSIMFRELDLKAFIAREMQFQNSAYKLTWHLKLRIWPSDYKTSIYVPSSLTKLYDFFSVFAMIHIEQRN